MDIIRLNGTPIPHDTVAAIGFFDGVHLAHGRLIKTAVDIGRKHGLATAVVTFDIHPKSILYGLDYTYITPLDHKIELIRAYDVDVMYVIEFTKEKAAMTPEAFITTYLANLHTIVCGFDFKFGVRGSGNVHTLAQFDSFETIVVEEITHDGYKIGSTHIRDLIQSGLVDQIPPVMGRYYSVRGEVVHGAKKGRMIGYPTANIDTTSYLVPKTGVYATMTRIDDTWYPSMSSVGHNPTLNCRVDVSVESHLFDFDQDLYGKTIEILFVKRLRDEKKFDSIEGLIAEIDHDAVVSRTILQDFSDKTLA
jgi:riboflavin kinase/FMN adenylyltransferase